MRHFIAAAKADLAAFIAAFGAWSWIVLSALAFAFYGAGGSLLHGVCIGLTVAAAFIKAFAAAAAANNEQEV